MNFGDLLNKTKTMKQKHLYYTKQNIQGRTESWIESILTGLVALGCAGVIVTLAIII